MTTNITGVPLPAPFLEGLRYALERLADGPLAPALDLYATRDAIVAKVGLPGPKPEDIDVTIDDGLVTIAGSVRDESTAEAGYVHRELGHGSFNRSFWLPATIQADAATATFKDGLLTLTFPKLEGVGPKHVKVDVA